MPSCAARPVPTISAVGVARPRAHGQAMINTATADDAPAEIIQDYCIGDPSDPDNNDVWLALAAVQHRTGHIAEHVIDYNPTNTYLRALIVGVLNTLKVAVVGVVLATILGKIADDDELQSAFFASILDEAFAVVPDQAARAVADRFARSTQ